MRRPSILGSVDDAVGEILRRIGKDVVLGLPLGLGKPVHLVNALYRRAKADPSLRLTILTALTLERPQGKTDLERRFLKPFVERLYGDCPDLEYAAALRESRLPDNVRVSEFYFRPGSQLESSQAQQAYISSNYTHAARDAAASGCNVIAHMVAKRPDGDRYSLSCNPDVTPDLVRRLRAMGRRFLTVAVTNPRLPYMIGEADVPAGFFDVVVDDARYAHTLFTVPKTPLSMLDFCIGMHASALIRDGGTLQIGIGELGDAVLYALLLRHSKNVAYRGLLEDIARTDGRWDLIQAEGGLDPFAAGLYASSEMLVDGFVELHRAGILKRRVYGHWALQRLINEGGCDPAHLSEGVLDDLASLGVGALRPPDFDVLENHGLFKPGTRFDDGYVIAPDGRRVEADLGDVTARRSITEHCLGTRLRNGVLIDAAFFLGSGALYDWLRGIGHEEGAGIRMSGVHRVNQLDQDPLLLGEQRVHARFVNAALTVTLRGDVVSDGLEDGRVLSGVGGQYDFVAMGHKLPTARSIVMLRSTRLDNGKLRSTIVPGYGHCTIPRHLRDIVVTEYGIADLRSRTDSDITKALLRVADSRFQPRLLRSAKRHGKVEASYRIPPRFRHNTPDRLQDAVGRSGLFEPFPLGTDFTAEEQTLIQALKAVKARVDRGRIRTVVRALGVRVPASARPFLERMDLARPRGFRSRVARRLLVRELRTQGAVP